MEEQYTCRNRLVGNCKDCERDYRLDHHPNNLNCPFYEGVVLYELEIEECFHINDKEIKECSQEATLDCT